MDAFMLSRLAGAVHLRRGLEVLELHAAGGEGLGISRDAFALHLGRFHALRRLVVVGARELDDEGLGAVAMGCPRLREVVVRRCAGVTGEGVGRVVERCRELRRVEVVQCPRVVG
ncbi:hypothetical protein HDU96_005332, partial [Phlyctochytrium bullatum]